VKIKLSQLKILIENFINELPEHDVMDSGAEVSTSLDPMPSGKETSPKQNEKDKKEFIAIIRGTKEKDGLLEIKKGMEKNYKSLYDKKKKYLEGREKGTGKLKEYEEDFLRYLGENEDLINSFKKSYTKLIKEFNKERKRNKKLFKEKGEDQIRYSRYLLKAKKLLELDIVKDYIEEEKKFSKMYNKSLDDDESFSRSYRNISDEDIKSVEKTDAEKDEEIYKDIRGNRMADKDLQDVMQNLNAIKKMITSDKQSRKTQIKGKRLINDIIRDVRGKIPEEKEENIEKFKNLNLDETINLFIKKLIKENINEKYPVDNERAISNLENLKTFIADIEEDNLSKNLKDAAVMMIDKSKNKIKRYLDRKEGDFFDEKYEMPFTKAGQKIDASALAKEIETNTRVGKYIAKQDSGFAFILGNSENAKKAMKLLSKEILNFYGEEKPTGVMYKGIKDIIEDPNLDIDSIEALIEKLEEKESRGEGDEKVEWSVIERIKDPDIATGRKSDREIKTDLEILEGAPNTNEMIENFLRNDKQVKRILKSNQDTRKKEELIYQLLVQKFEPMREFSNKVQSMGLKEKEEQRYEELSAKDFNSMSKKEQKELDILNKQVDKIDAGRRIRNFITFMVKGLGDPKNKKYTYDSIKQEFAKRMISRKEKVFDDDFKAKKRKEEEAKKRKEEERKKKAKKTQEDADKEIETIKKIQILIKDPAEDGSWDDATTGYWSDWVEKNIDIIEGIELAESEEQSDLTDVLVDIANDTLVGGLKPDNLWGWFEIYVMLSSKNQAAFPDSYEGMLKFIEYQEEKPKESIREDEPESKKTTAKWQDVRDTFKDTYTDEIRTLYKEDSSIYGNPNAAGPGIMNVNLYKALSPNGPGLHVSLLRDKKEFDENHPGKEFKDFISTTTFGGTPVSQTKTPYSNGAEIENLGDESIPVKFVPIGYIRGVLYYDEQKEELLLDSMGDYIIPYVKLTDDRKFVKVTKWISGPAR
tara:strand:+ start:1836 stop:4784 length:2949 start_codon:yes stop_codon:yes gene_type:complete